MERRQRRRRRQRRQSRRQRTKARRGRNRKTGTDVAVVGSLAAKRTRCHRSINTSSRGRHYRNKNRFDGGGGGDLLSGCSDGRSTSSRSFDLVLRRVSEPRDTEGASPSSGDERSERNNAKKPGAGHAGNHQNDDGVADGEDDYNVNISDDALSRPRDSQNGRRHRQGTRKLHTYTSLSSLEIRFRELSVQPFNEDSDVVEHDEVSE